MKKTNIFTNWNIAKYLSNYFLLSLLKRFYEILRILSNTYEIPHLKVITFLCNFWFVLIPEIIIIVVNHHCQLSLLVSAVDIIDYHHRHGRWSWVAMRSRSQRGRYGLKGTAIHIVDWIGNYTCILRWWWLTSSDNNDCMHSSNKSANGLQPLSFLTHTCVNIHHRFDDNCYNFQFPTNSDQTPLRFTHTQTSYFSLWDTRQRRQRQRRQWQRRQRQQRQRQRRQRPTTKTTAKTTARVWIRPVYSV